MNPSLLKLFQLARFLWLLKTANYSHLQFGSFFFGEMPNCTKVLASAANMCTLIFKGANWCMKQCKLVRFITIRSISVEIRFLWSNSPSSHCSWNHIWCFHQVLHIEDYLSVPSRSI
jgi:hypothetical protein